MFNFSGSEIVFLLLLALIILGPEKLPEAVRKFGSTYAEFKKMTTGFQTELKQALDEPMREMRDTADAFKKAASFDVDLDPTKPVTAPMAEAPADAAPVAADLVPVAPREPVFDPDTAAEYEPDPEVAVVESAAVEVAAEAVVPEIVVPEVFPEAIAEVDGSAPPLATPTEVDRGATPA